MARGDSLDNIMTKAEALEDKSVIFKKRASKLKCAMLQENMKMCVMLTAVIIVCYIFIIIFLVCVFYLLYFKQCILVVLAGGLSGLIWWLTS